MNVVKVILPAGKKSVGYGTAQLGVDGDDNSVDIPKYVAKAIVAAGGTCSDPLTGTVASLLAAGSDSESNYLFYAFGLTPPTPPDKSAAGDLLAERGEPGASFA